jgi:hypothetical protein
MLTIFYTMNSKPMKRTIHLRHNNNFNTDNKMKKLLSIMLVALFATLVACGPSAEEKAAMEKAKQDSVERVQKAMDDSIASVQKAAEEKAKQDSIAAADMEKARQDSIAAASKKTKKSAPKAKETVIPKETPQVGHKKPGAK